MSDNEDSVIEDDIRDMSENAAGVEDALDGEDTASGADFEVIEEASEDASEPSVSTNVDAGEREADDNEYFDDEIFLGDDKLIELTKDSALFQQADNVVSWHLDNFFKEDGTRRGKYSLMSDPPVFRIESPDGQRAEFLITKNLAVTLGELFTNVNRGYNGLNGKESSLADKGTGTKTEAFFKSITDNPVRAGVTLMAVCVVLFALVFL